MNAAAVLCKLNALLSSETSAVETYRMVIALVPDAELRTMLEEVHVAHAARANQLRLRIEEFGADCDIDDHPWSSMVSLVIQSNFCERTVIGVLEDGEYDLLEDYQNGLDGLDEATRAFVFDELLPGQEQSHETVSAWKKSLSYRSAA